MRDIGGLIAANERAVSIVPADIADELARLAGVGMVAQRFGSRMPQAQCSGAPIVIARGGHAFRAGSARAVCQP